jgi:hypothetical protein
MLIFKDSKNSKNLKTQAKNIFQVTFPGKSVQADSVKQPQFFN